MRGAWAKKGPLGPTGNLRSDCAKERERDHRVSVCCIGSFALVVVAFSRKSN